MSVEELITVSHEPENPVLDYRQQPTLRRHHLYIPWVRNETSPHFWTRAALRSALMKAERDPFEPSPLQPIQQLRQNPNTAKTLSSASAFTGNRRKRNPNEEADNELIKGFFLPLLAPTPTRFRL